VLDAGPLSAIHLLLDSVFVFLQEFLLKDFFFLDHCFITLFRSGFRNVGDFGEAWWLKVFSSLF